MTDILNEEIVPFARLSHDKPFGEGEEAGSYAISEVGTLFARNAIQKAVRDDCDLVVIDEVGPLELSGKGLMPAVD